MLDDLTVAILKAIKIQAERMDGSNDDDSHIRDIEISVHRGYKRTDPWLVTYKVGGYSENTSGKELDAVVTEYMRRKGWNERNKPMVLLTNVLSDEEDHGTIVLNVPDDSEPTN